MIIFDLDGTLADCEHRRHFVDPSKSPSAMQDIYSEKADGRWWDIDHYEKYHTAMQWKPDWKSFYEACDKDRRILPTWKIFVSVLDTNPTKNVQIWSGRCESTRKKTESWLGHYLSPYGKYPEKLVLKMRPVGDNTPDDQLKEKWLNERCSDLMEVQIEGKNPVKHGIDFVFDDRPKVIRMWRRRGIFVFNCCQHDEEF